MEEIKRQGITEATLRAIVVRIEAQMQNAPIEDILRRIDSFVEGAVRERDMRGLQSNEAPDLAALRTKAGSLLDAGQLDKVSSPFDAALEARRRARAERAVEEAREDVRLLEEAAEYDRLAFNIEGAVERYVNAAVVLFPGNGKEQYVYLGKRFRTQLKQGDLRGDMASLLVAAEIARFFVLGSDRVSNPLGWAVSHSALGDALSSLGDREIGTALLVEALTSYRRALEVFTREADSRQWALIQNNLGLVLGSLGERQSHRSCIGEAICAFRNALKETTHDSDLLQWSRIQNNIGNAWLSVANLDRKKQWFRNAATAFRKALTVRNYENDLIGWAKTRDNLANAIEGLALEGDGTAGLQEVVAIRRDVVSKLGRESAPLQWGLTCFNLGNSLANLRLRETTHVNAENAIAAYKTALEEVTPERWMQKWATINLNLGSLLLLLGSKNIDRLKECIATLGGALAKLPPDRAPREREKMRSMLTTAERELAKQRRNKNQR
jgi:tetratricopeptide (TPR) repeat protein